MPAPRNYPQELRERATRLVHEAREQDPELSLNAPVVRIGQRVGGRQDYKKAAAERRADRADMPGSKAAPELAASGPLDGLFAQIDSGEIELTGDGGFILGLIKATLERGLQAELTSHLGYEKGEPEASAVSNSRNGTTPKKVATQTGDVDLAIPRDREGSFTPTLVPKGSRRLSGLDEPSTNSKSSALGVRGLTTMVSGLYVAAGKSRWTTRLMHSIGQRAA